MLQQQRQLFDYNLMRGQIQMQLVPCRRLVLHMPSLVSIHYWLLLVDLWLDDENCFHHRVHRGPFVRIGKLVNMDLKARRILTGNHCIRTWTMIVGVMWTECRMKQGNIQWTLDLKDFMISGFCPVNGLSLEWPVRNSKGSSGG